MTRCTIWISLLLLVLPLVAAQEEAEGKMFAVVIGQGDYKDSASFPKLPFALEDAKGMYEFLVAPDGGGLQPSQIQYVVNGDRMQIFKAMDWLKEMTRPEDTVVFYYAGHGQQEDGADGKPRAYLVPVEATGGRLNLTGVPLEDFKKEIWELRARQVALILDCCYSGTVVCDEKGGKRAGVAKKKQTATLERGVPDNRYVVTACAANEQAIELKEYRQGAFTFYLLQGLQGNVADRNRDRRIDVEEAFQYLQRNVSEVARLNKHQQTPTLAKGKDSRPYYLKNDDRPLEILLEKPAELKNLRYVETKQEQIWLEGWVRYGTGVKEVRVAQDNATLENRGRLGTKFQIAVSLSLGKNVVSVVALDKSGAEKNLVVTVNRLEDPLVKLELRPAQAKCQAGDKVRFEWGGTTESGATTTSFVVDWQASTGKMLKPGLYQAGQSNGIVTIHKEVNGKTLTARATVTIVGSDSDNDVQPPNVTVIEPVPKPQTGTWKLPPGTEATFFDREIADYRREGYFGGLSAEEWDHLEFARSSYQSQDYESSRRLVSGLVSKIKDKETQGYLRGLNKAMYAEEIANLKNGKQWGKLSEVAREALNEYKDETTFSRALELAQRENIPPAARQGFDAGVRLQKEGKWDEAVASYRSVVNDLNAHYRGKAEEAMRQCEGKAYENWYAQAKEAYRAKRWEACARALDKALGYQPNNAALKNLKAIVDRKLTPTEPTAPSAGDAMPANIWQACWNESGQYFDFTQDIWVNLAHDKQFAYAQAYQAWYGKSRNMQVEKTVSGMAMRLIPPGKFWMGSPDGESNRESDETRHKVLISKPYYIGKTEVTQAQWKAVMGNEPSDAPYFKNAGNDAPIENISWEHCQTFCSKAGVKLPSEAQWEYACRAGVTSAYNLGNSESDLGRAGWYTSNSGSTTHPVGQKTATAWGCYDFHGNVWEWCQDWYHYGYNGAPTDGSAWETPTSSYRVDRGGGWGSDARYCRSAYRNYNSPDSRYGDLGLRCLGQ